MRDIEQRRTLPYSDTRFFESVNVNHSSLGDRMNIHWRTDRLEHWWLYIRNKELLYYSAHLHYTNCNASMSIDPNLVHSRKVANQQPLLQS